MRTKNIQAELDLSDVVRIPRHLVKREDQFLRLGDTLVSSANSWNLVGKCCWVPDLETPAAIGGFVTALRANPAQLDSRYLFHWFSSPRTQKVVRSLGNQTTSISNLNLKRCEALKFPLPPLSEQRRIAGILDHSRAIQLRRSYTISLLDNLLSSVFVSIFGDPVSNPFRYPLSAIGNLGRVVTGRTPPSADPAAFGKGVPFLTPGDLDSYAPPGRTLSPHGASLTGTVRAGATLVCCIGTIGKAGQTAVPSAFNQQINAIEWNESIDDDYGFASMKARGTIMAQRGSSTTLPILNKSSFQQIEIPVPPQHLQAEYASWSRRVRAFAARAREQESVIRAGQLALQYQAFRGEL